MRADFMFTDIERELELSSLGDRSPLKHKGGGNFLCAVGLLAFTEALGKYLFETPDMSKSSRENFNAMFYRMGKEYIEFDEQIKSRGRKEGKDVYDVYRCGLIHEFFIKDTPAFSISMPAVEGKIGIWIDDNGLYHFSVYTYYRDLLEAYNSSLTELIPESER